MPTRLLAGLRSQALLFASAGVTVAATLAASCGGGEGTPSRPASPTRSPMGTPLATPVRGDVGAALLDLFARGLGATYKATYRTMSPEGEEAETYVVFSKPPLTRIDTIEPGSSGPTSALIAGEGVSLSCSGGPEDWQCFESAPFAEPLTAAAGPFVLFSASDLEAYEVEEAEGRLIAGQTARCFRLTARQGEDGGEPPEPLEYCLNGDGVPLYSAPLFGDVEATEYSVDVSEEDFAPPAEPQD